MKKCSCCGGEYPDDTAACLIDHTTLDPQPSVSTKPFPWTAILLTLGLLANGFVIYISSEFYSSFPYYSQVHVSGVAGEWVPEVRCAAIISFAFGFSCVIFDVINRRKWIDWLGLALALSPGPLGWIILKISVFNGLTYD
jgi:hypothetical protein